MRDISGNTYGRWTVVSHAGSKGGKQLWNCMCECGNEKILKTQVLEDGISRSCGCLKSELVSLKNKTHGLSNSCQYQTWLNMRSRCDDTSNEFYLNYGGRGITYNPEWKTFDGFWRDMQEGYSEGMSLERIDVNGLYEKSNCKWIPLVEQAKNRTKPKNNTSGKTGVDIYENRVGVPYARARWVENGKCRSKYFNILKYGHDKAVVMAWEFRKEKLNNLGYGEFHGEDAKVYQIENHEVM